MKICIDTETTGLIAGKDEILQLSIIDEQGNVLFNEYFRPDRATSWPGAQRVNRISPEDVADKPSISAYKAQIERILSSADVIIGYNLEFDFDMLYGCGIDIPDVYTFDVMLAFAQIYGEWSEYHEDYKWQKLITCAHYYKYTWDDDSAHDSLGDVRATLYCYNKMMESDDPFCCWS